MGALGASLQERADLGQLAWTGALGIVLLSLTLYREAASRLLFVAPSLAALLLYVWAGTESVRVDIVLEGGRGWAAVGELTVSGELPASSGGGAAFTIAGGLQPVDSPVDWLAEPLEAGQRAISANLAAGVSQLRLTALDGSELLGPYDFTEPDRAGLPPVSSARELDADIAGPYRLLPISSGRDLRASLELRNGGPPVYLLLRLDERLDGIVVRAWPARRELSIHELRGGALQRELAGGYATLRKPAPAGFQSLLRELLRAWLIGLLLLAAGGLVAPLARVIAVPADWRAPGGTGLAVAVLIGIAGLWATSWVASELLERIPHVQDSVAYLFQAQTFALGRLTVPLPPVPDAFEHEFILMREGLWFSKYPPGFPVVLALGVLAGAPWLVSPLLAAFTLVLVYTLGRQLYENGGTGVLAALLLLCSPFFLFMSGSMMSHPAGLFLTSLGLLLVVIAARGESTWPPFLAGLALGWLIASRQLTGLAVTAPAAGYLALARLRAGRSPGALLLFGLGLAWPVLGLLAYNRAVTGNPLLNPFELWWDFDRLGFGPGVGMHGGHDLGRGLWNTYANLTALQTHLFGWPTYLTLAFAAVPFATGRARGGDWLCAAVAVSIVLSYVAYWADGIMYGPRYYYEASSCLALLTARGTLVAAEAAAGSTRSLLRRRPPPASSGFYLTLIGGLVISNLWNYLPPQVQLHRGYNYTDGSRQAIVRQAGLRQAIVFVPTSQWFAWWEYGSVFSANDPLLRNSVIYARDLGPETNRRVIDSFPTRTAYRLAGGLLSPLPRP